MKKPPRYELRFSKEVAACFGLAFALACSSSVGDDAPVTPVVPGPTAGTTGNGTAGGPPAAAGGLPGQPSAGNAGTGQVGTAGSTSVPLAGTGGMGAEPPPFPNPAPYAPAAGLLRRLTHTQFRNAVRDLLGVEVDTSDLQEDDWTGGFASIGAGIVSSSEDGVVAFQAQIEAAVNAVMSDNAKRQALLGCTPTGMANDTCIRGFVQNFGLRAWRRPLETAEVDRIVAVATKAATDLGGAVEGARWATVAILNSPNFLYRPELGAPAQNGAMRLTPHEMAGRMAFLIWNSGPDKWLLDQAASGGLATPDGLRAAATKLLDADKGRESVGAFAEEYMEVFKVLKYAKDPGLYPEYTPTLQAAMLRDMRETWAVVAFDDGANAMSVFTTPKAVVNSELAKLYGLDATGLTPTTFATRTLPENGNRIGVMSKSGFLAVWANQQEGSPTLRGKFMREALMCLTIPPPPPGTNIKLEDPPAGEHRTKRQKLDQHRSDPACAGCHALMDPLGLPFENFDAIGRWRTTDDTLPVDASGDFNGHPVANARELAQVMAADPLVAQCLVRKYYTYATGRLERPADGSVINSIYASFKASGFQFRNLVLDVVSHEAFSTVAPQQP